LLIGAVGVLEPTEEMVGDANMVGDLGWGARGDERLVIKRPLVVSRTGDAFRRYRSHFFASKVSPAVDIKGFLIAF
jgi:hypothetical protein